MARRLLKKSTMPAICHIEIPAPDLAKAKAFYTKIFGWTIEQPAGMDDYAIWHTNGNSGGFNAGAKQSPARAAGVCLYIAVPNIPSKLRQIAKAGGKIVRSKTAIGGGFGFYASIVDPNGNHLRIWSRT